MRLTYAATACCLALVSVSAFAACTSSGGSSPSGAATCGPTPEFPYPTLQLAYPIPGTTAVPDALGAFVVQGLLTGPYGNASVTLAPSSGSAVALGMPTPAPSPLPSPIATTLGSGFPYYDVPVPALSPATTYTVSFGYTVYNASDYPTCSMPQSQTLGTFTTQ